MINRIRKLLFGSISAQLIYMIIVCIVVTALYFTVLLAYGLGNTDMKEIIGNANEIFVTLNRDELAFDELGQDYLDSLSKQYNMKIAIANYSGRILLADSQVKDKYLDMEDIKRRLQGSYSGGTFYRIFDIEIENNEYKLVVWYTNKENFIIRNGLSVQYYLFIILSSVLVFILTLYILLLNKIRYIKYLTNSITQISFGNLNCKVEIKGHDELSILAAKINAMTDRLKNTIEQERAAESFKKELITNVSHDLRTPLTSIIGYLELLKNKELAEAKKTEYVDILNSRADRLKYLIDDLFEFSKISSGGEQLNYSSIDIIELLGQCLGEYAVPAAQKGMTFEKRVSHSAFVITADAPRLARVFENIISNAIKYGENDSAINVTVTAEERDIVISFKNISSIALDSNVENIFDRFYRMDKSRNSHIEGSGLGLAIARSIVELHNGEIWANARDNEFEISVKLIGDFSLLEAN